MENLVDRRACPRTRRLLPSRRGIECLRHHSQRLRHHEHERMERNPGDHVTRDRKPGTGKWDDSEIERSVYRGVFERGQFGGVAGSRSRCAR